MTSAERSETDLRAIRAEPMPLIDLLLRSAEAAPDAEALVFPDVRLSYADLAGRVRRTARRLWTAGVRPEHNVGIMLQTSADYVEALFAVAACGATAVMLNARYRPAEIGYVIDNANLTALVTVSSDADHSDFVGRLGSAFPDLAGQGDPLALTLAAAPRLRALLLVGDRPAPGFATLVSLDAAAGAPSDEDLERARLGVRVRDPAMILYTSGTSANPKGCLLSHEAVTRQAQLLALRWAYTADDRVWSPLPLFHVAAMCGMLAIWSRGGVFIGMPHFDPSESLRTIEREGATSLFVPFVTFLQAMAHAPEFAEVDLSRVRHANTCFAAQPEKVGAAWRARAPHILHVGTYGLTEAFGVVATGGPTMDPSLGFTALGWPLLGVEVRIADPVSGVERGTDEEGEVLLRGPTLLTGYYGDPERTSSAFDNDGWFHTGDIGSVDAAGHMQFHGRFKDMLKVGGENVAAAEVEAVLATHPAVRLAQVVGIPDERLATFKVPRHIRFVSEWPMSASKIQKFRLRETLMTELGIEKG